MDKDILAVKSVDFFDVLLCFLFFIFGVFVIYKIASFYSKGRLETHILLLFMPIIVVVIALFL